MYSYFEQEREPLDSWSTYTSSLSSTVGSWMIGCMHRKKRFTSFPSPAGMSLTKLPLSRKNSVMTSLFPPRESLVVTFRLRTGNSRTFFYSVSSLGRYVFGSEISYNKPPPPPAWASLLNKPKSQKIVGH